SLKVIAYMVGGAVPPLLGRAFGLRIAQLLDAYERRLGQSRPSRGKSRIATTALYARA
ncbi:MAG: hypothetical protein JWP44_4542, partial [Mucilaginibacter sp.]|nr:hypothetical protein [Mucilaginibacter sp.]